MNNQSKGWTPEEKDRLKELYPLHTDKELCELLNKRPSQLRGMKERLGLRSKYKCDDLCGQHFGNLTVIGVAPKTSGSRNRRWYCKCSKCGDTVIVGGYWLKHSNPASHCSCSKGFASTNNPQYRHGGCGTRLYRIWCGMHTRTTNPKAWNYKYYGARGIRMCDEWSDFAKFRDWALSHGYTDNLSIDRKDNDGDYSPDNCRWVALDVQKQNRRPFNPHQHKSETA